jgi:hypothetical protein
MNKMILIRKSKNYVHLNCTFRFIDVCIQHFFHLLNSLQDFASYTCSISNVCVPKLKQFTWASKITVLILDFSNAFLLE